PALTRARASTRGPTAAHRHPAPRSWPASLGDTHTGSPRDHTRSMRASGFRGPLNTGPGVGPRRRDAPPCARPRPILPPYSPAVDAPGALMSFIDPAAREINCKIVYTG